MNTLLKICIFFQVLIFVGATKFYAQNTPNDVQHLASITQGLKAPFRIANDSADNIYVTDVSQKCVLKYDAAGNFQEKITTGGYPTAIAINNLNEIFIGDGISGKILKVETDRTTTVLYSGVQYPSSMVFDDNNNLYVVDSKLKHVTVLNLTGDVVRTIGNGTFTLPTGIAYDSKNNRLLVSEHGGVGGNVQKCGGGMLGSWGPVTKVYFFDLLGNLINSFGCFGNTDGKFYRAQGMAVSQHGFIYITDPYQSMVSVFDETGVFINKFGEFGNGYAQLNTPMDIEFDTGGRAFVTSMNNSKIEIYSVNEVNPTSEITSGDNIICPEKTANIVIDFKGTAPWTFTYTVDGLNPTTISNTSIDPYILTVSDIGTYEVTALSDSNYIGTTFTGSATITANPLPTSNITSGNTTICPGETTDIEINFTGIAPWTFTYSIDGINHTSITTIDNPYILTVSSGGLYEITALSSGTCTGSSFTGSANISVNPLPSSNITIGGASICAGGAFDIPIDFTGTAPWTFSYSNGTDTFTITTNDNPYILTASKSGIYQVASLSDANNAGTCFTGSVAVTVNPLPTSTITSGDAIICEGETSGISIDFTGTAPWTFTYTIDGLNPTTITTNNNPCTLTVSKAGTYRVTALSDAKCTGASFTGSANIIVNPLPSSTITNGNEMISICSGETADLTVEFTGIAPWTFTYTIDDLNPTTVSTTTNNYYTLKASSAGTYEVKVISDANCTNNTSIGYPDIKINQLPTSTITSGNTTICEGQAANIAINFTGTAPWTFAYTVNDFNPTTVSTNDNPYILTAYEAGIYEVIALADANKTGTCFVGSTNITVNPKPVFNLGTDVNICEGETFTIDAGTYFENYLWSDGSVNQILDVNTSGNYSVIVTDINGCKNSDDIIVTVNPAPVSEFIYKENNLEISFLNQSLHANSFLWDFGDTNTSFETEPVHVYETSDKYTVFLTAINDYCRDSTISKTINLSALSVGNLNFDSGVKIYPNPSKGLITIEINNPVHFDLRVEITNIKGQNVCSKLLKPTQQKEQINLTGFQKGFYTIKLISKDIIKTEKVILID